MRESNFWLKIIIGTLDKETLKSECQFLIDESEELKKILGSICSKTRK